MPEYYISPGSFLTSTYCCLQNLISLDRSKSDYYCKSTENFILECIDNVDAPNTVLVQTFSYYNMNAFIPCSSYTVVMLLNSLIVLLSVHD